MMLDSGPRGLVRAWRRRHGKVQAGKELPPTIAEVRDIAVYCPNERKTFIQNDPSRVFLVTMAEPHVNTGTDDERCEYCGEKLFETVTLPDGTRHIVSGTELPLESQSGAHFYTCPKCGQRNMMISGPPHSGGALTFIRKKRL
jgi:DNA-directed RNA polymerase subunit RPC12/RpoP